MAAEEHDPLTGSNKGAPGALGPLGGFLGSLGIVRGGETIGPAPPIRDSTKGKRRRARGGKPGPASEQRLIEAERDALRADRDRLQSELAAIRAKGADGPTLADPSLDRDNRIMEQTIRLRSLVEEHRAEVQRLNEQLRWVEAARANEREESIAVTMKLEEESNKLRTELEKARAEQKRLGDDRAGLMRLKADHERHMADLRSSIGRKSLEVEASEERVRALEAERSDLLGNLVAKEAELNNSHRQIEELNDRFAERDTELEERDQSLAQVRSVLGDRESDLVQLREQLQEHQARLIAAQKQRAEGETVLDKVKTERDAAKRATDALRDSHLEQQAESEAKAEEVRRELIDKRLELEAVRTALVDTSGELDNARNSQKEAEQAIGALRTQLEESHTKLEQAEQRIANEQVGTKELREELEEAKKSLLDTDKLRTGLDARRLEVDALQAELKTNALTLKELRNELENARIELDQARITAEESGATHEAIEELEAKHKGSIEKLEVQHKEAIEALDAKHRTMIDEVEEENERSIEQTKKDTTDKLNTMRKENEAYRKRLIAEVEVVKGEAGKQLADVEHAKTRELERTEQKYKAQLDAERRRLEKMARDHADQLKDEIDELRAEVKEIDGLRSQVEEIEGLRNQVEEIEGLRTQATQLQKERDSLTEHVQHVEYELEDFRTQSDDHTLPQRLNVAVEAQSELLEALEDEQNKRSEAEENLRRANERLMQLELDIKAGDGGGVDTGAHENLKSNHELVSAMLESTQDLLDRREKELLNALKQIGRLRRELQQARYQAPIPPPPPPDLSGLEAQHPPVGTFEDWDTHVGQSEDTQLPTPPSRLVPGNQVYTANPEDIENDDDTFVTRLKDMFGSR